MSAAHLESYGYHEFDRNPARQQELMQDNGYPGRWLAMGRGEGIHEGEFIIAYSFGGRSDGSKNRTAILEGSAVRLVAPGMTSEQMAQVSDAALVYYHASDTKNGVFAASNGAQTRPVLEAVEQGSPLIDAVRNAPTVLGMMEGRDVPIDLSSFEPDAPINTPRITGVIDLREDASLPFGMAVVRKDPESGMPIRKTFEAHLDDISPGEGFAIQTYGVNDPDDKETPVPHFTEDPYFVDMSGSLTDIAERTREAIGERTFAAAVVRAIDLSTRQFVGHTIINTRG